jgi:large subunit ribosomal protein L9
MKVVFLEDVPNVGEIGDIKEVAAGYGRNFLIPRGLAVLVDSQAASIVESRLRKKARLMAQIEAEMLKLAKQIEGKAIVLKAKAGAKEKLYGSVTNADIAEALEKSIGVTVDRRKIELAEPIREVGSYEITIRLTKDITPKIKLKVAEEEKKAEAPEKAEGKVKKTRKAKKTEETPEAETAGTAAGEPAAAEEETVEVTPEEPAAPEGEVAEEIVAEKTEETS